MDRIKRLSYDVLDKHKSKFGESFSENKKVLGEVSIIRSKGLKNEIAGYITKFIKKEIRDMKTKQAQIDAAHANELAEQAAKAAQEEQAEGKDAVETPETEQVVEGIDAVETPETEQVVEGIDAVETPETEQVVEGIDAEKPAEQAAGTNIVEAAEIPETAQEESKPPETAVSTDEAATKAE